MGLFGFGKHKETNTPVTPQEPVHSSTPSMAPVNSGTEVFLDLNKGGLLNLQKNEFLNLSKTGINLTDIRVAAGWDVNHRGKDYDLDLCSYPMDASGRILDTVYYGDKHYPGLQLDKDNLTGEGDGDDENIFVDFSKIPDKVQKIIFAVVIYQGASRGQTFGHVQNAFVRLVDQSVRPEKEICRFNLSSDGKDNTAVVFAEITRTTDGWTFSPIGDYYKSDISGLKSVL